MQNTYFELMARGLEGPMSESGIDSFATRAEAELALKNARYNEMSVSYWIIALPVESKPVAYLHTRERGGKWQGAVTESADEKPFFGFRSFATREAAIADSREWLARYFKARYARVEEASRG
jgi:hypothetical protein